MDDYINRLYEELEMINETLFSLNMAIVDAEPNQKVVLSDVQSEILELKHEVSTLIEVLENVEFIFEYSATILQKSIQEIDFSLLL
jgi:hypothetical protein